MTYRGGPRAGGAGRAALRAAARPLHFVNYLVQRQVMRASAFPPGRVGGTIPGAHPHHLVVIGEATSIGYGTLLGELSIAGHLARQLATRHGQGVVWSTAPFPDLTVHTASAVVSDPAVFVDADVVVVMLGIGDAVRSTPVRVWTRLLGVALDTLRSQLSPDARIIVAEAPPLDEYPYLPRAVRARAGRQVRRFNEATRGLVTTRPGCISVPFPPERLPDLRRPDSAQVSGVYSTWANALLAAID
ncbi:GDSL-type esterase/lipase family protein [Planctomonas psychrotolerans]|uniref:GDSL-type esterase/lipase family protein n=1 Tax=Planctomonas psychrotolerans TaxID=2528712 RepID=UPI0012385F29|nr:GDSL-type esterase/lipase family protein [Planctomonas psychrotolerans]